ncbi:hypothetical protein Prudu_008481 [Prunus dulcis]|uniref:Uncharacterized protein n=1 Tax=Prunus dulcis TaxID=3755 RepID=A0A4Y1R4D3_PRUDU|nr:hypothetical protein Prudu_008481 [Prunus dulcis]
MIKLPIRRMTEFESIGAYRIGLDESYRSLPSVYLAFLSIWFVSACSWTINTYNNRHLQTNNLQWTLASVPLIKALQLTLSFLFWYSCFHLQICSLWMSFGVYTASFVSFLLISHGYCIMCERLSVTERRTTASLGCVFYLTLVGYRASVPYFSVLLLLNYFISFYVIFHHISQNLLVLREQLSFIDNEDVHAMHDAVYTKYIMFKWTFRSRDLAPRFSVMPTLKSKGELVVPPIYSIPTTPSCDESSMDSVLVIIQHPHAYRPTTAGKSCQSRGQPV